MTYTQHHTIMDTDILTDIYEQSTFAYTKDVQLGLYTLKKSERLAAAVTIILGMSQGHSVLASECIKTALGLVTDAAASAHSASARRSFGEKLTTLAALLGVCERSGFASVDNVQLLLQELKDLASFLHRFGWMRGHAFISEAEFTVDQPRELERAQAPVKGNETPYRQYKDTIREAHENTRTPSQTTQERTQTKTPAPYKGHYNERMQRSQKDRRATILGIVQQKDAITIKDVAEVIKDVSEKTIQRELLALVQQGVLKKEGERRWSTYSLARP